MTAHYAIWHGVAVISLNHPPVNGLGLGTRAAALECVQRALSDSAVTAVVITGEGRGFSGGADINEFGSPQALQEPSLHTLIERIETAHKPVVAAVHGMAMGGGLELALGCHYRVAQADAQIALPEVKLGILPGAGGTQRLPRAIGLERALEMIVSGSVATAGQLADSKLFDAVVADDVLEVAVEFARKAGQQTGTHPCLRDRLVNGDSADAILDAARGIAARAHRFPAPRACVEAVAASLLPFGQGMQVEREAFLRLLESPESRALRHAFFAERAANRIPDLPADTPVRSITSVAVIGAGTMGSGISMNFLGAGIPVTLLETRQEAIDRGMATIRASYEANVKKGRMTQEAADRCMTLLRPTLCYEEIGAADLVIEAVFEDMAVKEAVFRRLDEVMKPGAILASNTSTLDLDRIAAFTDRPRDVVGMHFFSPANVMRLLEVVRGKETAHDVLTTVMQLAKRIGKIAVVAGVCDGFIGNRMLEQYSRQAGLMLDEGAQPEQIDRAAEAFGFAMGPFRMIDMAGNDIAWAIRKRRATEQPDFTYSKTGDLLCEMGRLGQKAGAGWYDYRPGDRKAYPSPVVNEMIEKHSDDLGMIRREISDQEIVERLVYALVNEGAVLLEEGIAARASDIDMVYLSGYGFPQFRGGPMHYAEEVGLANVVQAIGRYAGGYHGHAWVVAPLLRERAESGGQFAE